MLSSLEELLTPLNIYWIIICCLWIEYFFKLYLCIRQKIVYEVATEVPTELRDHLDDVTFDKARKYGMDKNVFRMFSDFYGLVVLTGLLHFEGLYKGWLLSGPMLEKIGVYPRDWDEEIGKSICFSIIVMAFDIVVDMPFSLYATFVLEEKHGFNNQTLAFFVKDFIKGVLVGVAIMSPCVGLIVYIVQVGGNYFFIWLWMFCFVVLMFLMTIYPMVIAPLFDKYTPLKDGPLRSRIEALAARIKFPLTKLYVVEGSKRSAHSNAYMYGFCNNKRIVLFDTLLRGYVSESAEHNDKKEKEGKQEEKGCTDEEVVGVLGHEFGHWKLNHNVKNMVISQVNVFLIFAFFAYFYQNSVLYEAFGFPKQSEKPILMGLIIVLQFMLQIYNTAMGYFMNVLSRHFEFQADTFSVNLGYGKDLKGALIKLNKDNLNFPVYDPLYSAWHHSHPGLLQRLSAINVAMSKLK